ncbi:MAG: hypothetical protein K5892_08160 [Acholeplasmatales bacterium]|nr:hypothetical protein [Acholeplasmatales bacterium]
MRLKKPPKQNLVHVDLVDGRFLIMTYEEFDQMRSEYDKRINSHSTLSSSKDNELIRELVKNMKKEKMIKQ